MLFKKRSGKEKGVDIALTKEMLVNGFNQNFDVGLLIAGDEDYVGLVQEVKRYGPVVYGAFFPHGLSETLHLCFDSFHELNVNQVADHPDKVKVLIEGIKAEASRKLRKRN